MEATPETKRTYTRLDVGEVSLSVSESVPARKRAMRKDTNPTSLAVRDAEDGTWYDLAVEPGHEDANVKSLRRAGTRYGRGVSIVASEGMVQFKTGPKRINKV